MRDLTPTLTDLVNHPRRLQYAGGGIFILLIAIGLSLPSTLRVERQATTDANPATVFALLNDFVQINKWSPLPELDPNARFDISGPRRGVGATMRWEGSIIGSGGQTITESTPYLSVENDLELDGGGHATSVFELHATDAGTQVAWRYEQEFGLNFFARLFGQMQRDTIESNYEKGLASLVTMAESLPRENFAKLSVEQIVVEASEIAYLTALSDPLAAAISDATSDAYFSILNYIDEHELKEAGAPIIISRGFSGSKLSFDAAIPVHGVTAATPASGQKVKLGKTYAGPVIRVKHTGSYAYLTRTHAQIAAYLAALGIERNGDAWESYVSDPTRIAENDLITYVYYPIRVEEYGSH